MKPRGQKETKMVASEDAWSIAGCGLKAKSYAWLGARPDGLVVHEPWDARLPVCICTTVHRLIFRDLIAFTERLILSYVRLLGRTIERRFYGSFSRFFSHFYSIKLRIELKDYCGSFIAINSSLYLFLLLLQFHPNFHYFVMFIQFRLVIVIYMMFSG